MVLMVLRHGGIMQEHSKVVLKIKVTTPYSLISEVRSSLINLLIG